MCGLDAKELCSGIFSDVMDTMGYRGQIITGFQKNKSTISVLGRARTLKIETIETDNENIRMGLSFVGKVGKGEILLVSGSERFAYFGEMMTKLSVRQGIEAIVIDGLTRDTNYTHQESVQLPILAKGYSPVNIKGRGSVQSTDVDIVINGVKIEPNDFVYIDNEAICIVPKEIEGEVIEKVKEKITEERRITQLIESGVSVEELLNIVKEF